MPNRAARSLVMQSSQAIGLIVHEPHSLFVEDPNIASILLGANSALSEADYQLSCLIADTRATWTASPATSAAGSSTA